MNAHRLATILLFTSALPTCAQQIQISKENKTIAITTSDDASTLADMAVITVGFSTYGKDQNSTYADASRISNIVISALTEAGINKDAIQSKDQDLSALSTNDEMEKARYAQGLRFEFSQHWLITVPGNQAANVLHLAITNGANDSGGIQWQLVHDDALEAEAAKKALEHARQIAEQMAKGLNTKLGPLVYASNQTPQRALYGFIGSSAETVEVSAAVAKINLKPLAITPERVTKSATVYAVFAIE